MPRLAVLLLALACAASAADTGEAQIKAFQAAMAGQDQAAKKRTIAALGSKAVGNDDVVLPLLVAAVADRQGAEAAIAALRSRTGLAPAAGRGDGGYPGYPNGDTPAAWHAWLAARTAEREAQEQIKKVKAEAEAARAKADEAAKAKPGAKDAAPATGDGPATGAEEPVAQPAAKAEPARDPDFGGLDRITFKTGGSLLCYVLSKRLDSDGNLISVRIVHPDQGGEETLSADLIARIEDDIR